MASKIGINDFHIISGKVIKSVASKIRNELIDLICETYLSHYKGDTVNPDSYFLLFPKDPNNRIIALPAAIIENNNKKAVSGIKWIASYPGNIKEGLPRASAVLILNNTVTGFPYALLEGAYISALRTAASAVLAIRWLSNESKKIPHLSIIGAGVISRNILETLKIDGWEFERLTIHDIDNSSSNSLRKLGKRIGFKNIKITSIAEALSADVVVFATNANVPYVKGKGIFRSGQVIINISLRDIAPEIIEESYNFFDDIDHCLKAKTSPHLAEIKYGNRDFVTGELAALISGDIKLKRDKPLIYSPFGLGVLDIAIGNFIYNTSIKEGIATMIPDFFAEEERW